MSVPINNNFLPQLIDPFFLTPHSRQNRRSLSAWPFPRFALICLSAKAPEGRSFRQRLQENLSLYLGQFSEVHKNDTFCADVEGFSTVMTDLKKTLFVTEPDMLGSQDSSKFANVAREVNQTMSRPKTGLYRTSGLVTVQESKMQVKMIDRKSVV